MPVEFTQVLLGFAVSFLTSIIGAISGIGGGVLMKPVLDLSNFQDISTISFLSSLTVFAMATVTLLLAIKNRKTSEIHLHVRISTLLAAGSVAGGIGGKFLFNSLVSGTASDADVGLVQTVILLVMILFVLIYMRRKNSITPKNITSPWVCFMAGLILGALSSFLGIGGGPLNIIVLFYLFDMPSKNAALNSIFIIFFSQIASLLFSAASSAIPTFYTPTLVVMMLGGVLGALLGGLFSKKMTHRMVERLYSISMAAVGVLCIINIIAYF